MSKKEIGHSFLEYTVSREEIKKETDLLFFSITESPIYTSFFIPQGKSRVQFQVCVVISKEDSPWTHGLINKPLPRPTPEGLPEACLLCWLSEKFQVVIPKQTGNLRLLLRRMCELL